MSQAASQRRVGTNLTTGPIMKKACFCLHFQLF